MARNEPNLFNAKLLLYRALMATPAEEWTDAEAEIGSALVNDHHVRQFLDNWDQRRAVGQQH